MRLNMPVVVMSAFALIAPAAAVDAKDKGKDKNKDKKEQKADDRRGGAGDRHDGDRHDGDRDHSGDRDGKITICHVPPGNPSNSKTLTVGESAWSAHSGHGDYRGACRPNGGNGGNGGQGGRFDRLDTNNDNVITANEWVGDRGVFDRLDRNDDGKLSKEEFSRHH